MKYEKPEVKMFKFDVEDVITTSFPTTTTTTTFPDNTTSSSAPAYGWDEEEF